MDLPIAAFVPVAALLIVVPGPDVLVVVRNAVLGRAAGVATVLGTLAGLAVHGAAAAVGLSALIAASATAFTALKLLGAAYLIYLGVQALWTTRSRPNRPETQRRAVSAVPTGEVPGGLPIRRAVRQGFLTNVLNPKVAVFFLAFLPQFVAPGAPVAASTALLATVFVAMTAVYLLLLVALTVHAAAVLSRPSLRRWLDRIAGTVLIGFGVRLAAAH